MNAMLGDLPTWNLSDLYSSPSGVRSRRRPEARRRRCRVLRQRASTRAKVAGHGRKAPGRPRSAGFEALNDPDGVRIGSYASLYYGAGHGPTPSAARFSPGPSPGAGPTIGNQSLVFFRLEITSSMMPDLAARQKKDPALAKYGPWLRDLPRLPATFSSLDEAGGEGACTRSTVVGRAAWVRACSTETIRAAALISVPPNEGCWTEPQDPRQVSEQGTPGRAQRDAASQVVSARVQGDNIAPVFSLGHQPRSPKDKEIE